MIWGDIPEAARWYFRLSHVAKVHGDQESRTVLHPVPLLPRCALKREGLKASVNMLLDIA